jgi:hypothetical protein
MIPIAEMAHKQMNSRIVGCGIYLKRFGAYIKSFNRPVRKKQRSLGTIILMRHEG